MKSFIITNPNRVLQEKLQQAGMEWQEWEGTSILITQEAKQIAQALGAVTYQTSESEWEDIFTLSFVFPTAQTVKVAPTETSVAPKHRASRENYIKLTQNRLEEVLKVSRNAFEKSEAALWPAIANYLEKARIIHAARLEDDRALLEHFKEEYRRILALPQVVSARYHQGKTLIYTNDLIATGGNNSTYHKLGKFFIVINPYAEDGKFITCHNLWGQVNAARANMQAPYVNENGLPCPSEILESLVELVGLMEYATTLELFFQFLENVQDDTPGDYLPLWPEVQPQ